MTAQLSAGRRQSQGPRWGCDSGAGFWTDAAAREAPPPSRVLVLMVQRADVQGAEAPGSADPARLRSLAWEPSVGLGGREGGRVQAAARAQLFPAGGREGLWERPSAGACFHLCKSSDQRTWRPSPLLRV